MRGNVVHAIWRGGTCCSFGEPAHAGEYASYCEADCDSCSPPDGDLPWPDLSSGLEQPDQKPPCEQAEHEYIDNRYSDLGLSLKEVNIEGGNCEAGSEDSGVRSWSAATYRTTANGPVIILVIRLHERPVREQPVNWQY